MSVVSGGRRLGDKGCRKMSRYTAAPAKVDAKKLKLEPHQVIVRPLVTEKGTHRATRNNQYAFEVNRLAEKEDVRTAVESLFNVRVLKVRTQNRKGKPRRYKFKTGRTKAWKKAIVTLDSEHRINFF
jgi:large subunit ribosomal protein L23